MFLFYLSYKLFLAWMTNCGAVFVFLEFKLLVSYVLKIFSYRVYHGSTVNVIRYSNFYALLIRLITGLYCCSFSNKS